MTEERQKVTARPEKDGKEACGLSCWSSGGSSPATTLERYQWPLEGERWRELAFCILHWAGQPGLEAASARRLVGLLGEFGMLEVEGLAAQCEASGKPDFANPDLVVMQHLLQRKGLGSEQAKAAVGTLCQAAWALQARHGGKVQRYLRNYGQLSWMSWEGSSPSHT